MDVGTSKVDNRFTTRQWFKLCTDVIKETKKEKPDSVFIFRQCGFQVQFAYMNEGSKEEELYVPYSFSRSHVGLEWVGRPLVCSVDSPGRWVHLNVLSKKTGSLSVDETVARVLVLIMSTD